MAALAGAAALRHRPAAPGAEPARVVVAALQGDGLFTAYRYHYVVEKDLVAALDSLKALALIYPSDTTVLNSLSYLQSDLGAYDDAVATAEQGVRADPRPRTAVQARALADPQRTDVEGAPDRRHSVAVAGADPMRGVIER